MDTVVQQEDGAPMAITGLGLENSWGPTQGQDPGSNILYIAVGYVKDDEYKLDGDRTLSQEQAAQFADFEEHVSPLDPNMSSVARYSPVYTADSGSYGNSVVVTQLVPDQVDSTYVGTLGVSVVEMENQNLQQNVARTQYLQMVNDSNTEIVENPQDNTLSMIPNEEQEEVLLITDQTTGISYSVAPEFMVERCLTDEQQLLEALEPDPLLDGDLLTLDENALKSQLSEIVIDPQTLTQSVEQTLLAKPSHASTSAVKTEKHDNLDFLNESIRRSQRQLEFNDVTIEEEEPLLNCVQTIVDKPVPTRARATLPETHLVIQLKNESYSVFAKRIITKATQFGPLEGKYVPNDLVKLEESIFDLKIQDKAGYTYRLDISDENNSNWMCFVKAAKTIEEQNLVVVEQGEHLFYVSTKTIHPKQELLVGYSASYAKKYNLTMLEQPSDDKKSWNCFECNLSFESSKELQKHLNIHDDETDENVKPKKRMLKRKIQMKNRMAKSESLECTLCLEMFHSPKYSSLRRHLSASHGIIENNSVYQHFISCDKFTCHDCELSFDTKDEFLAHNVTHEEENPEKHTCGTCGEKYATIKQLKLHQNKFHTAKKPIRCPACYKIFASQERMRRHMVIHASEDSKPYQCTKCSKRFLTTSALQCHEKYHISGRKIFECPICREKFPQIIQLKQHTHKHCIDNKFTCPYCNKIFLKYSIIRKHIRAFHCEKKHYCNECSKAFPSLDKLRLHLLRHSDHREFLCADCGKQFKRKDKLSLHCRKVHGEERENTIPQVEKQTEQSQSKKFTPKVLPTDYHRFIYKCHTCLVGFKRRGMLVNHLAKRHPEISPETVPELNLPILRTTRDYYCQYCDKVYKSSSKRKAHILKIHPGAELPMSNRKVSGNTEQNLPNPTYSQTVGSVTTRPQSCQWCHKQYASKAKLLQHQRKKHTDLLKMSENNYYEEKDKFVQVEEVEKSTEDINFKRQMKVTDLLNEMVSLEQDRDDSQFYHLIPVSSTDTITQNCEFSVPESRLYRLLTTESNLAPPR